MQGDGRVWLAQAGSAPPCPEIRADLRCTPKGVCGSEIQLIQLVGPVPPAFFHLDVEVQTHGALRGFFNRWALRRMSRIFSPPDPRRILRWLCGPPGSPLPGRRHPRRDPREVLLTRFDPATDDRPRRGDFFSGLAQHLFADELGGHAALGLIGEGLPIEGPLTQESASRSKTAQRGSRFCPNLAPTGMISR